MALFNFKPPKKKKVVLKKNMNWTQAKSKYPKLSPFGDRDKDGVKNWLDCKPFDKKRQDDFETIDERRRRVYPGMEKPWSEEERKEFLERKESLKESLED